MANSVIVCCDVALISLSAGWASELKILGNIPFIHSFASYLLSTYCGPSMANKASQVSLLSRNSHSREYTNNGGRGHSPPPSPQENLEKSQPALGHLRLGGHFLGSRHPHAGTSRPCPLEPICPVVSNSHLPYQTKSKENLSTRMNKNK